MATPQEFEGAPVEGGAAVVAPGFGALLVGQGLAAVTGGAIGALAEGAGAEAAAGRSRTTGRVAPIAAGEKGYVLLTRDELILCKDSGVFGHKPGEVLVRVPRDGITDITFGDAKVIAPLDVTFTDGAIWAFGVQRVAWKNARALAGLVGPA